jgi:hypothetical protein
MERALSSRRQRAVRSFVDQAVAEAVLEGRAATLLDDELETLKLGERWKELLFRGEALEERERKAPTGDGRERDNLTRLGGEAVEAGLQRLLDERRYHRISPLREAEGSVLALERAALEEVAHDLLDEQWIATRAVGEQ